MGKDIIIRNEGIPVSSADALIAKIPECCKSCEKASYQYSERFFNGIVLGMFCNDYRTCEVRLSGR